MSLNDIFNNILSHKRKKIPSKIYVLTSVVTISNDISDCYLMILFPDPDPENH